MSNKYKYLYAYNNHRSFNFRLATLVMDEKRKRQRTESMSKAINQKKESKLWYEEANSHVKAGNLEKAVTAYNKVRISVMTSSIIDEFPKITNLVFVFR